MYEACSTDSSQPLLEAPLCDFSFDIRERVICNSDVFFKGLNVRGKDWVSESLVCTSLILLIIKMDVPLIAGFPWSMWLSTN